MPSPIASLMPQLKRAADLIADFTGDAAEASRSNVIQDAVEVISAVAPLVESFGHGIDVTPDEVRVSLIGMDQALADFDAEIARQQDDRPRGTGVG